MYVCGFVFSGDKLVFGHQYLRPHQTFHEASRKFFLKELFRCPHFATLPIREVVAHCVVMDLGSYCRGRVKGNVLLLLVLSFTIHVQKMCPLAIFHH